MSRRRSRPYHKRWHGDALKGYQVLSLEERGAYTTLLDQMYDYGGPVRDDVRHACAWLNCDPRVWKRIRQALVVQHGKLRTYVDADGVARLVNDRVQQELGLPCYRELVANLSPKLPIANAELNDKSGENPKEIKGSGIEKIPYIDALLPLPESTEEEPPTPLEGGAGRRKPRRAIPVDFPTADLIEEQQQKSRNAGADLDVSAEAERFRNHALSTDRRCSDWSAAWRNWVLKAIGWAPKLKSSFSPIAEDDPWRQRLLNWRINAYWNSDWGPKPGKPGYLGPDEAQARAA